MTSTTILALYSAFLSTLLGLITITNYLRDRRFISIEKHVSFDAENAFYDFIVSNTSSRAVTIIDCMFNSFSRDENWKLQIDWGISPHTRKKFFSDDDVNPLECPVRLQPGDTMILTINSEEIIKEFSSKLMIAGTIYWHPTEKIQLEIKHSMSKNYHLFEFDLEQDEHKYAQKGTSLRRHRRKAS